MEGGPCVLREVTGGLGASHLLLGCLRRARPRCDGARAAPRSAGSWSPAHLPSANTEACAALTGSFPEPAPILHGKNWWTRVPGKASLASACAWRPPTGLSSLDRDSPPVSVRPPSLGPLCVPWSLLGSEEAQAGDEEGRHGSLREQRVLWANLPLLGWEEATGGPTWGTTGLCLCCWLRR